MITHMETPVQYPGQHGSENNSAIRPLLIRAGRKQ